MLGAMCVEEHTMMTMMRDGKRRRERSVKEEHDARMPPAAAAAATGAAGQHVARHVCPFVTEKALTDEGRENEEQDTS